MKNLYSLNQPENKYGGEYEMRFVFAVYTSENYKERHLPGMDKSDYDMVLYKNEFGLKFRHLFRDKTLVEVENERQLRTKIFIEYKL